ncbi:hypothetical protein CPJCM30710_25280 [Clostridium polyendosporum]|uniref:HTH cro/C1-type domain-containing protein n=1 Tax=Clostridium polyendosporum TaxID=69208 RepID=A0A919S0H0_9CLOT|nr:helix-turn-helix transcriptional regulator [Clostridium polyendosporum]GIM29862.1 hypothetical protein CPJCM30710_25280 [Clostridium polyendosporum]
MNIGKRISEFRKLNKLTGVELAKRVGITREYLSHLEKGSKTPSFETLQNICSELGITLSDFFKEDTEVSPQLKELINNAKDLHPDLLNNINDMISTLKKNYKMVKTTIEGKNIEYVVDLNVKPNGLTKEEELEAYQLLQRLKELEGK